MLITEEPIFTRFWYPVAFAAAVAAGPTARRLLGQDLVLWRAGDQIAAALDRCPHREAKLSGGWLTSTCQLVCPYHGWEYGSDGRATRIPQMAPHIPIPPQAVLNTVRCQVRYGLVWICLSPEPLGAIPDLPEFEAPGWRVIPEYEWMFDCSAAHLIENNFDPAHVAFVHRATFGNPEKPAVPTPDVSRTEFGFEVQNRIPVENRHGSDATTERRTTSEFHLPFHGIFRIGYPDGLMHIMFKGCCPVDDGVTRLIQFVVRNDSEDDASASSILEFDHRVEAEDQALLATVPTEFPLDLTANVHIKSDRTSIELRRLFAELLAGQWQPMDSTLVASR
ncbi:MAG TPA: aromatic ring-hydroxylating dioxygenase subunit alpha [Acidimicrobiales bacterium]|nr:aromatic ring-hydroxylating dioxygenase subunit alpha [Acidimicrobiales bacterium]